MTLSPVFRSEAAVGLLEEQGLWARLAEDTLAQAAAVRTIQADLDGVLGASFRTPPPRLPGEAEVRTSEGLRFLQEYFFLILFRSIFRELGVAPERLDLYAELNFCIKGTITAADNLFDDQAKSLLPLATHAGPRFMSILQLMAFERLQRGALDRGEVRGTLTRQQSVSIQRGLIDRMAEIGVLEGSEEGGVEEVPTPAAMIEGVHRIRGGALFALAFVAPSVLEVAHVREKMVKAESSVARLGTAFQIVDDLTDFEFDVGRRSHNVLVAQIVHHGSDAERRALEELGGAPRPWPHAVVEERFRVSARAVLERAYDEARGAFRGLQDLGYWFDPRLSDQVVHAIVGLEGVARMEAISTAE